MRSGEQHHRNRGLRKKRQNSRLVVSSKYTCDGRRVEARQNKRDMGLGQGVVPKTNAMYDVAACLRRLAIKFG